MVTNQNFLVGHTTSLAHVCAKQVHNHLAADAAPHSTHSTGTNSKTTHFVAWKTTRQESTEDTCTSKLR
jgi:hypothetical protein